MIRCQEERKRMLASLSQTPPPPERAAAEASVQEETIPPAGEVPQLDGEINRVQNGEEQEASAATTTSCMPDGSLPAATPGSQSLTISQGCGKSGRRQKNVAFISSAELVTPRSNNQDGEGHLVYTCTVDEDQ